MGNLTGRLIKKPLSNFNVENRAFREIEKSKPTSAPHHSGDHYQALDEQTTRLLDEKSNALLKRLKDVKVDSIGHNVQEKNRSLPENRDTPAEDEFGFNEPRVIPSGKITLRQVLNLLDRHANRNNSIQELAAEFKLPPKDVEHLVDYFLLFRIYESDAKGKPSFLKQLKDETKRQLAIPAKSDSTQ